jgi:FSR family fosmidomycin resistance protein-like MFS transporter
MDTSTARTNDASGERADVKVIFGLFLVHFLGDFYMAFVSPLLPVLKEKLSLSLTQIGLVTGATMLMAFIVQPSVGYLADRYRTRIFVLGGPLLTAVFIPLFGWATGFYSLLIYAALGSIGQSMFHPPAAGMVPDYSGRNLGFSMAIFILGGTIAFGVGPVFVSWFVTRVGFEYLPWCGFAGAFLVISLFFMVPPPKGEKLQDLGFIGALKETLGPVWRPLFVIWLIIVTRVFVVQSFFTFFPVLLAKEGYDLIHVGWVISAFVIAGSLSGLITGHLADRIGYKPVFLVGYLSASPFLILMFYLHGPHIFWGAFLAGFFTLSTLPLATAMAQTYVTRGKSLVASLTMGLAYGAGGMLSPLVGHLADQYSIRVVLGVVFWSPLAASVLVYYLPQPADRRV